MSIQQSFPQFVVDVFYSQSVEHTASLIRRLCETTKDSSHVFPEQDWPRRNWLTEECSEVCQLIKLDAIEKAQKCPSDCFVSFENIVAS